MPFPRPSSRVESSRPHSGVRTGRRLASDRVVACVLFIVVATSAASGVVAAIRQFAPALSLDGIYLLVLVPSAAVWGLWGGVTAAVVGNLTFDFLFARRTISTDLLDPDTTTRLVVWIVTACVVSVLAERVRARAAQISQLAREQAALRRVATAVAQRQQPALTFSVVAAEIGTLLRGRRALVTRHDGPRVLVMAEWRPPAGDATVPAAPVGSSGSGWSGASDVPADPGDAAPSQTAPITVGAREWGAVSVECARPMARTNVDELLAAFSDLVATSIGQADAQAELAASRARIVATADETRRRIERDLHDGIQQRLVTLGLTLRVLRDSVPSDSPDLRDRLVRVEQGLGEAVDELREIARGVHPAILSQGGLGPALRSVARRAAVPVQVSVAGDLPDLAEPIEIAAYYVVSEALTNAAKHAAASRVVVDVRVVDECLRVEVSDDGCGGATRTAGSGLIGLSDRVDALGGALSLDSPPGRGTRITATLPLTLPADVRSDRRLAGQAG